MFWFGHLSRWTFDPRQYTDCKLTFFLLYFFRHYSSSVLVLMALEKFFALYFPLRSKSICTVKTAQWTTGGAGFIFFAFNTQYLVFYRGRFKNGVYSSYFSNLNHRKILDRFDSVIYSFGTFTIMFLVNSAIIYKFIKAKRESTQASTSESTSKALSKYALRGTAMVITVSVMFIVLTTPVAIPNHQITKSPNHRQEAHPIPTVFMVSMQYLNHSINGFLYCIVGTKFTEELYELLRCCIKNVSSTNIDSIVTEGTNVVQE